MRFLAKYGRFGIQFRPIRVDAFATGATAVTQQPIYLFFREGLMTPEERELALTTWSFEGSYQEQGEVTTVAPDYRIGVFDSEQEAASQGWPDELRVEIENFLINYTERLPDVIVVPRISVPAPWPRYDEWMGSPEALLRKLADEGYDLELVLAYERQSQNRADVVEVLEEEIGSPTLVDYAPAEEEILG